MLQLRNTSTSSSRRRHTAALATFAVLGGSAMTACSNSPLEPDSTAPRATAAPTGPVHTGYTPGWGLTGDGTGTELQAGVSAGMISPLTPADSAKVAAKVGTKIGTKIGRISASF
jgi:hypothetical protein